MNNFEQQTQNIIETWFKYGVIQRKGNLIVWSAKALKEMPLKERAELPEDAAKRAVEEFQANYKSELGRRLVGGNDGLSFWGFDYFFSIINL